jgi:transcriptional regulator of acetoin/glycerol metabolism
LVIEVPPLRSRVDDIGALADHFLAAMEPQVGPRELESEALARLRSHPWPGNVRELRNVLELAAASSERTRVGRREIEHALRRTGQASPPSRRMLRETLQQYGGNVSAAARAVGLPRSTFRDRLKDGEPERG